MGGKTDIALATESHRGLLSGSLEGEIQIPKTSNSTMPKAITSTTKATVS
jgi:hypothetical protein